MQVSLSSQSRGISRFYLSIISLSMNAQILSHYHLILSRGPNLISLSSHSQKMPKSYLSIISLSINAQILSHYHITLMRWDCLMIQSHIKSEFMRQSISRDNPSHEIDRLRFPSVAHWLNFEFGGKKFRKGLSSVHK